MKVTIEYNNNLSEDEMIIQANPQIQDLSAITNIIEQRYSTSIFRGKKNEQIYFIRQQDIVCFRIENKVLYFYTATEKYSLNSRLYSVKKQLTANFLQISKSEIINVDYINYLQLNRNGTIEIKFKNNDFTYSSRRYLKIIKEALKL
ncbi:LytTR family DNA-binding domain-containing protein [Staphylococcus saprophyticus]|uniref:LytTR family DNA-binding domain-containing protein n=1 Tax=Staphylococcus saprophyticus TaxID=29385 RepID=UPI000D1EC648|nr:LytTR family DNA-binding domain-containing protein [Staphylococcus saprophyticus]PTJ62444.1 LytTR family transcriptional regulator [Staphylococcus saprophyticus]